MNLTPKLLIIVVMDRPPPCSKRNGGKPCAGSTELIPLWSAINHARNRHRVLRCLILCSIGILLSLPFEACESGIEYLFACLARTCTAPWLVCVICATTKSQLLRPPPLVAKKIKSKWQRIIDFDVVSDAKAEAQARQLTTEQLGGEYEIVDNALPLAAAATPAALAAPIITQTQTAPTLTPARTGAPTLTPTAMAPATLGGNTNLAALSQDRTLSAVQTVRCWRRWHFDGMLLTAFQVWSQIV